MNRSSSGGARLAFVAFLAVCTTAALVAQTAFVPAARFRNGQLPAIPILAPGGGEVLLELSVNSTGSVSAARVLQTSPLFTEAMSEVVRGWQFVPAESDRKPVDSRVLVAGMFRPPSINTPAMGEPPKDVAAASPAAPYPLFTLMPVYPPLALESGIVLVEVLVDAQGGVDDAQVVRSGPPFDSAALDAAHQWRFRPARIDGLPSPTFAYIVFAFRQPVL